MAVDPAIAQWLVGAVVLGLLVAVAVLVDVGAVEVAVDPAPAPVVLAAVVLGLLVAGAVVVDAGAETVVVEVVAEGVWVVGVWVVVCAGVVVELVDVGWSAVVVLRAVGGKEAGTCSISPGVKVADISPLPAGASASPSTWPISCRTMGSRSMCWEAGALGKSTLHPQPAAVALMRIDEPFVSPNSRPGNEVALIVMPVSEDAGAIAPHSCNAWLSAAFSWSAVTAVVSDVAGAAAASASMGLLDDEPEEGREDELVGVWVPAEPPDPEVEEAEPPLEFAVDPEFAEPPLLECVGEPTVTV